MSGEWSARRAGTLFFASIALAACSGSSHAQTAQAGQTATRPMMLAANHSPAYGSASCGPTVALPDFSALVERYGPAVVNVQVLEHSQSSGGDSGDESDDPFNDFFRRFGIPAPNVPHGNMPPQKGTGSGFIVSPDGYILTNAHVVMNADEVTVKLVDRREYRAKVIGIDERTDVAVIKIDGHSLPVVKIGDANKLKPGQWVVAIGSPFDFDNSATAGIVSATARPLQSEANNYVSFIQTDVPINPGNSGGPLFNTKGEVVGINSQIFSQTGGYMGLSFAIPIDVAVNVEDQIIRLGHVVRGRIGVLIQDVNAQLAESFGLDRPRGALVSQVEPGGPADRAGVKPGDVILAVDNQIIERYGELSTRISNTKPGSDVQLSIWRNRQQEQLNVHVALLNEHEERTASRAQPGHGSDVAAKLGLTVRALTPDEKQQAQTEGSLIVEQASGPAASAGVQPGDVILGVNGKPVRSLAEFDQATKTAGKTFALRIQRQDTQQYVPLELP